MWGTNYRVSSPMELHSCFDLDRNRSFDRPWPTLTQTCTETMIESYIFYHGILILPQQSQWPLKHYAPYGSFFIIFDFEMNTSLIQIVDFQNQQWQLLKVMLCNFFLLYLLRERFTSFTEFVRFNFENKSLSGVANDNGLIRCWQKLKWPSYSRNRKICEHTNA